MAIFTFDDLNELERMESEFFGPRAENLSTDHSPSAQSVDFIRNYSKSLSVRDSRLLGKIRFTIN